MHFHGDIVLQQLPGEDADALFDRFLARIRREQRLSLAW